MKINNKKIILNSMKILKILIHNNQKMMMRYHYLQIQELIKIEILKKEVASINHLNLLILLRILSSVVQRTHLKSIINKINKKIFLAKL